MYYTKIPIYPIFYLLKGDYMYNLFVGFPADLGKQGQLGIDFLKGVPNQAWNIADRFFPWGGLHIPLKLSLFKFTPPTRLNPYQETLKAKALKPKGFSR